MSTNTLKQALEIVYGDIKNINKRVKNIESASAGVLYNETTKSAVAYQDNVSANACPYALLNKVGGMSYKSENLANITEINYRLATNGTLTQGDNENTTDFIEVKEGETYSTNIVAYTTSNYLSIAYYDSNKAFVSGMLANQNVSTITIPSGIAYMRASYRPSLQDNLMINKGSTLLPYQPYFENIRDSAVTSMVVSGNLLNIPDVAETTTNGITYKIENGVITLNGTATQLTYLDFGFFVLPAGTYYLKAFGNNAGSYQTYFALLQDDSRQNIAYSYTSTSSQTFTLNETTTLKYIITIRNAISVSNIQFKDMLVKGSTAPTVFKPYVAPITKTIPQEIQALEGYGWGINDTCYNYIDFENKKFIQKVGTRAYQSGDEEDTSVLTDLTTTYYELETPVETNISQYIDDNSIQISANGTITYDNTYQQAVPYEYLYLEKVGANNE